MQATYYRVDGNAASLRRLEADLKLLGSQEENDAVVASLTANYRGEGSTGELHIAPLADLGRKRVRKKPFVDRARSCGST